MDGKKGKIKLFTFFGFTLSYPICLLSTMTAGSGAFSFKPTFSIAGAPGGQCFFSSNERKEKVEFTVKAK